LLVKQCIGFGVCRLHAPGEEAGVVFVQPPQSHSFPLGVYGQTGVKVSVQSLPRQPALPQLACGLLECGGGVENTYQAQRGQPVFFFPFFFLFFSFFFLQSGSSYGNKKLHIVHWTFKQEIQIQIQIQIKTKLGPNFT
jgi:hypothetical protein